MLIYFRSKLDDNLKLKINNDYQNSTYINLEIIVQTINNLSLTTTVIKIHILIKTIANQSYVTNYTNTFNY